MSGPMLSIRGLVKNFSGLIATDNVDLDVERGQMHALIGPNGAGKTTLIGQITGQLMPNGGSIQFDGREITRLSVDARARLGLARSFQISSVFDTFTAEGNVALSAQARQSHSFKFWTPARRIPALRQAAHDRLMAVGLAARSRTVAANLAHGEHRQLELAMALATEPKMLLLDEPMAGLGSHESKSMTDLLRRLKSRFTILLVEHDMDVVFSLADRISVLVGGRLIASGTPEEIRNNPDVRYAYLGEDSEDLLEEGAPHAAH